MRWARRPSSTEDRGAAIVDINMGCPVRKVTNGDAGSALMRDLKLAASLIEACVKAVKVPVTLKMRMGWDHDSLNAPELARIAEDLGAKMVTVHGRTRNQMYKGEADWALRPLGQGRGDDPGDRQWRHLLDRGCRHRARAIGRGRGDDRARRLRPAVAAAPGDGRADRRGRRFADPSIDEQYGVIAEHYDDMLAHYGNEVGVNMMRKHIGWYTKGLHGSAEFRNSVNQDPDPDARLGDARRILRALAYARGGLRRARPEPLKGPGFGELFAALPVAVLVIDPDGRIAHANRRLRIAAQPCPRRAMRRAAL